MAEHLGGRQLVDHIDPGLIALAAAVRARYPGVRIVEAHMTRQAGGELQQLIRYQAPLSTLEAHGLVTDVMYSDTVAPRRGGSPTLPNGDGYHLCAALDQQSVLGCWDLSVFTGATPRERPRIAVNEARKILRRFAGARKARRG